MKEIIAVSNQKGGVGKSTTANALGAYLFQKGYKVLYVDMDSQENLSYSMEMNDKEITSLNVLMDSVTAQEAIVHTPQGDLIPASADLANADLMFKDPKQDSHRLKKALEPILGKYDYIVIDTPPAIGTLTINALTACNSVIVPTQADVYSLQGIGKLVQTIQTVKQYANNGLSIKGFLITRYNGRTVLSKDMTDLLQDTANQLKTVLYQTRIRECTALKEAQANQQDIFTYAPKSNAAIDYASFVKEVLKKS